MPFPPRLSSLPPVMAWSARARVGVALALSSVLWLAVAWALDWLGGPGWGGPG